MKELRARKLAAAKAGSWAADAWVFPSKAGKPSFGSAVHKPYDAVCDALEIPMIRAHDFRHTWNRALRRAAEGVVQRSMTGHTNEKMADGYDRVSMDEKRAAMGAALTIFTPKSGENGGDTE